MKKYRWNKKVFAYNLIIAIETIAIIGMFVWMLVNIPSHMTTL